MKTLALASLLLLSTAAYSQISGGSPSGALNTWQSNYLGALIGAADYGNTVHATGLFVGDSTLAGSNAINLPADNISTWVQEIQGPGLTPKIAELLGARFGRATGRKRLTGSAWRCTARIPAAC